MNSGEFPHSEISGSKDAIDIIFICVVFYCHIEIQRVDDDLVILSWYDGTICVFIDGASDDRTTLFLAEWRHIRSAAAKADS